MSLDAIIARLDLMERQREAARKEHRQELKRVEDGLKDVVDIVRQQNGRVSTIERDLARDAGARDAVAKAAAEAKAVLEERQKSLAWKIKVAAGLAGTIAALATAAGVLSQIIYHGP